MPVGGSDASSASARDAASRRRWTSTRVSAMEIASLMSARPAGFTMT
eukprot:CAMPEP_0198600894 /NCGR_PEP_ID=MMETSP1462-20131121/148815_1 /TAXON_ID=1333877 /ORGANISM="Brandtodinium nutriculum, Strain RCC3387" /LENGTH=46 /DNA_ID= /DNA_START= /DNA_END= /DNA_ORIENTATION=